MKWMQQQSKYENIAYAALWGLLFAVPLLSLYVRTASSSELEFNWQEVFVVWRHFAVYLLLFLVHNFLLAPLLVYRNKRWLYALLALCMVGLFTFYQCNSRPDYPRGPRHHAMEQRGPEHVDRGFGHQPPPDFREKRPDRKPPIFFGERDIVAIVVLILMCGMNLGIKLYFRTRNDHKKLQALEKENLEQQLEYLRYQINPHFFMNTLNNIHALVDIDPEKAKDTILELSKMMRFVLYEGDKKGVPLSREFDFIRHYIELMKLRYTDKVKISVELPKELGDSQIPPLILITFIENAFKHGISYQHESFVDIRVAVSQKPEARSQKLTFTCRNSKANGQQPKANSQQGGVGLTNVKKRLDLLYDSSYTLNIQDGENVYNVELTIPLNS
jgi:hypothetical protein